MGIRHLIQHMPLPRVIEVQQKFLAIQISDIEGALKNELAKPGILDSVQSGMRIALAVGSRGLAQLPLLVRVTVEELKKRGAFPFIVPAMGSHGGASAEGQRQLLANLGITEESSGCPIISSMDVVEVGKLDNGLAVLMDKQAFNADGIVVLNRVKPHNAFTGPSESGLVKMVSIGLGKQRGADSCHAFGFKYMPEHILEMAKIKLATGKILFGIGTVENAYDQITHLEAVPAESLIEADQRMLLLARSNMPRIMFEEIDVLIVDRIGKEFSGGGMDGNITGRHPTPYKTGGIHASRVVVFDVTQKSQGNSNGMGMADIITRALFEKIDYDAIYANALTSTVTDSVRIPMIMENEREAIQAAIKTCNAPDLKEVRLVRIKNSLDISEIYISESLLEMAKQNPQIEVLGELKEMSFNEQGDLLDQW